MAAASTNAVFGLATTTTTSSTTTAATTTTTTRATTTTNVTTTAQTTTTGGAATGVDADLLAAKSGRSKLGARIVQAELDLGETVSIQISLSRKGTPLAGRTFTGVRHGDRVLILAVPRTVGKGAALLKLVVSDRSGHERTFTTSVRIGKLGG